MIGQVPYLEEVLVRGTFHQQMGWAKKRKRPLHQIPKYIIPTVSQAACLGHTLGSSEVTDTCKTLEKEEIMCWQTRILIQLQGALTRMPREAPTKHILNVKAIPTSHWEFWLEDHYLQTVMEHIYRQKERGLKEGKCKDVKITTKQKAKHWKGGGEDFDRNSLAGTEGEREWEHDSKRERWKGMDRECEILGGLSG